MWRQLYIDKKKTKFSISLLGGYIIILKTIKSSNSSQKKKVLEDIKALGIIIKGLLIKSAKMTKSARFFWVCFWLKIVENSNLNSVHKIQKCCSSQFLLFEWAVERFNWTCHHRDTSFVCFLGVSPNLDKFDVNHAELLFIRNFLCIAEKSNFVFRAIASLNCVKILLALLTLNFWENTMFCNGLNTFKLVRISFWRPYL